MLTTSLSLWNFSFHKKIFFLLECLNANVKKRKKPSPSSSSTTATTTANTSGGSKEKKKRDLEVRKDLTLPTAPTAGVDNVFQVNYVCDQVVDLTLVNEIIIFESL